jgi:hypothetical protein
MNRSTGERIRKIKRRKRRSIASSLEVKLA